MTPSTIPTTDVRSIFNSHPFKFLVGPGRKEFTMHSALVAHQSKALDTLVNGGMKEAIEKCVVWDETDEETFIRFCQFAYTGSYDGADPKKRKTVDLTTTLERAGESEDGWEGLAIRGKAKKHVAPLSPDSFATKKEFLWYTFTTLHQNPDPEVMSQTRHIEPGDNCADVFLSHARVYVFADYHGIDGLQTLALRNLRRTLTEFTLDEKGSWGVIKLVDYCFKNTSDKGVHPDPLRTLVSTYTACKFEELWMNHRFRDLIDSLSEFPRCLLREILHRLD